MHWRQLARSIKPRRLLPRIEPKVDHHFATLTGLNHVTLATGERRWWNRSDIPDDHIDQLAGVMATCDARGSADFPVPGHRIQIDNLAVRSSFGSRNAIWLLSDQETHESLVTMTLATEPMISAPLWQSLHMKHINTVPLVTSPDQAPPLPWLGVLWHQPIMIPEPHSALDWLQGIEQAIAWTWIEINHDR